jgi:hypothetical protein
VDDGAQDGWNFGVGSAKPGFGGHQGKVTGVEQRSGELRNSKGVLNSQKQGQR